MIKTACMIVSFLFCASVSTAQRPFPSKQTKTPGFAMQLIQTAYGPDIDRVKSTDDPKDDLAMAAKLLGLAGTWATDPSIEPAARSELVSVTCRKVMAMTATLPSGYGLAMDAASIMATHVPDAAKEAATAALDRSMRRYTKAVRNRQMTDEQKTAAKNEFINNIEPLGDQMLDRYQPTAAEILYKRTMTVARLTKDVETGKRLIAKLNRVKEVKKTVSKLEAAKRRTKTASDKKAAAAELVKILITDLDDPRAARLYSFVLDPEEGKLVKLAAADPGTVDAVSAEALGAWYRKHAEETRSKTVKRAMLLRAKAYFERFTLLDPKEGVGRLKVKLALGAVNKEIENLPPPIEAKTRKPTVAVAQPLVPIAVAKVDLTMAGKPDLSSKLYNQIRRRSDGQTAEEQQAAIVALIGEGASPNTPWYYGTGDKYPRSPFGGCFYSYGNQTAFDYLLANGADPNFKVDETYTPLIAVIRATYLKNPKRYLSRLIAHGADVNGEDANGSRPIGHAAYRSKPDLVRILRANGAVSKHPLHIAAMLDDVYAAHRILKAGGNVNEQSKSGHTALYHTVIKGGRSLGVFRMLVAAKADVNLKPKGETYLSPLEYAAFNLRGQQARILREAGAESRFPLHDAASIGDAASIAKLVAAGHKIEGRDHRGYTPLMRAALNNHLHNAETVKALIAAGADINATRGEGKKAQTALDLAYFTGYSTHTKTAKSLLAVKGVKVKPGYIVESSRRNDIEAVRLMIGLGISANTKNSGGHRPLDYAEYYGFKTLAAYLKKMGAKNGKKIG